MSIADITEDFDSSEVNFRMGRTFFLAKDASSVHHLSLLPAEPPKLLKALGTSFGSIGRKYQIPFAQPRLFFSLRSASPSFRNGLNRTILRIS